MREIRPSGSEGGVGLIPHPYPYHIALAMPHIFNLAFSLQRLAFCFKTPAIKANQASSSQTVKN